MLAPEKGRAGVFSYSLEIMKTAKHTSEEAYIILAIVLNSLMSFGTAK
jgi:hypothetical protein